MNATVWKEYSDCIRTITEFSESTDAGSQSSGTTMGGGLHPVPSETILQWLTCFQVVENATKEVDVRAVLAYVQVEPTKKKKSGKKASFRAGVSDMLIAGQKRQELLYGNIPFSHLHEKCVRWTTLIYYWIHHRVLRCDGLSGADGLEHDEVERYLHFLATAAPMLGPFPTEKIESRLLALDKGHGKIAPKCGMSEGTQQLQAALADCVDAANKDSLVITWDFIRPSSVPTIVLEHLSEYAAEWLNTTKSFRPANEMGYVATVGTRRPHRRSSSTPPQSSSFVALQYLWETKLIDRELNFSPRTLYQFEWTIGHIGYVMMAQLSSEKIDRAYFAVPVLIDLICATEAFKELRSHAEKPNNNQEHEQPVLHTAMPSLVNNPDTVVRALQSAVDLYYERHAREVLKGYKSMDSRKDVVKIDGSKQVVVSTVMFRLLVEIVEPTLCLLRRYAEVLESSTVSCPCWQRGLQVGIEAVWKILASATLRMMDEIETLGDISKRLSNDKKLLNSYLVRL